MLKFENIILNCDVIEEECNIPDISQTMLITILKLLTIYLS